MKKDFNLAGALAHIKRIREWTLMWVLREPTGRLTTKKSERKPVAHIGEGDQYDIIFPSASIAAKMLRIKASALNQNALDLLGNAWRCVPATEYLNQKLSYDDAVQAIARLRKTST